MAKILKMFLIRFFQFNNVREMQMTWHLNILSSDKAGCFNGGGG